MILQLHVLRQTLGLAPALLLQLELELELVDGLIVLIAYDGVERAYDLDLFGGGEEMHLERSQGALAVVAGHGGIGSGGGGVVVAVILDKFPGGFWEDWLSMVR